MHKAVITNLHKPSGQYMLKKTPYKFHDIYMHGSPAITAGFLVLEVDFTVLNFDNAAVGYADLKNIG